MIFNKDNKIRIRVAAIILENENLLLIAHKKQNDIYWLLPGGGVNFGESLDSALKRELMEELGVSINVGEIALISDSIDPAGNRHILNIIFKCSLRDGKYSLGKDKRLHNFQFFGHEEVQQLQIFPPINKELNNIINNKPNTNIYLGERWMDM